LLADLVRLERDPRDDRRYPTPAAKYRHRSEQVTARSTRQHHRARKYRWRRRVMDFDAVRLTDVSRRSAGDGLVQSLSHPQRR
jgi:hypothetical protein